MRFILYAACVLAAAYCYRQSHELECSSELLELQAITKSFTDTKPEGGRASFGLIGDEDPAILLERPENQQLLDTAGELHRLAAMCCWAALALLVCPLGLEAWRLGLRFKAQSKPVAAPPAAEEQQRDLDMK